MTYEIFYKPSAVKELEDLPKKFQTKVLQAVEALRKGDFYKVEKLRGQEGFYRGKRAWPYRILFILEEGHIKITNIAHRQGVYK